jgi:hypothetical protein
MATVDRLEIESNGVTYMVPAMPSYEPIAIPLTFEEFEAAYVMWRSGADPFGLARHHCVLALTLSWCFLMRHGGELGKYTVHYKDSNQPTM